MAEKIGRFEIQSQLAQSPFATVCKALDTESQQTVALKVVRLDRMKDHAALTKRVFAEAEQAKPLNSPNITGLYGVGDEGDLFLAAMEYIQGVSVATTLARHDGFSIWDLQDIARQVCHALDHANVHKVVHHSLEPEKIMVQWDGMTKVLAFGCSMLNSQAMESAAVPELLRYAAPEQLRSEACDIRSEIFSLGAILYEMATEQKAFAGDTADQIHAAILESTPPLPHRLKPNVNQALSALIMKAIAKSPTERYQSGQELVRDLEQCKAGSSSIGVQAAASVAPKAAAKVAAAGAGTGASRAPSAKASTAAPAAKPKFAADPTMAEDGGCPGSQASFSDISELPPIKEVHVPAPSPSASEDLQLPVPMFVDKKAEPRKPRVNVGAAARKAVYAIKRTPPKWYLYSVSCALFFIALYIAAMSLYNHLQDRDTNGTPPIVPLVPDQALAPESQNTQERLPQTAQDQSSQPEEGTEPEPDQTEQSQPEQPATSAARRGRVRRTISQPVGTVTPGQLSVSSTPVGAKISFDGSELCQTPCTLTGIAPGQHTITAAKSGFTTATRNLTMPSGANSSLSLELAPLGATISVNSTPAGAVILLDGKDTGKLTPSAFTIGKSGTHTVTLQRAGYLDGSSTVELATGQPANVNLALTHLGDTEEIRSAGGHFKKVFGGNNGSGMGVVSIKTQPKGAQIMVNNRVLDKTSPFDFYLNPGTYVIDITMDGYQPLHRVIAVQEGEKVAIQETLSASGN